MTIQKSTFNGIVYNRWKGEWKLTDPTWLPVDDKLGEICKEFPQCDENQRERIREFINDEINNTLVTYSLRMAIFAMRQNNPDLVRNSFIALAMINSKLYDYRDWHILSVPIHASYKLGENTDEFLRETIKLADKENIERMEMELGRNRGLQLFDEVETKNGVGLMGRWYGKINSSYNLKQAALEIVRLVESDDKYLADDIDSARKLPEIWLSGVDDKTLELVLQKTKTGIQVSGVLRPKLHYHHLDNVLWVKLYEFPTEEDVKTLFAISQQVKTVGYSMFTIKQDRLFCVVISRCVMQDCVPYETQKSIERYKHKLVEIVKRCAKTGK